jgi:hypothetical protein
MAFPKETVQQAWDRAGGRCECKTVAHEHGRRCNKPLVLYFRGKTGRGAWESHARVANGGEGLDNCEILCWDCNGMTLG